MLSLVHVGHSYWHPFTATSPIMPEEFGEHLTPQLHVGASSLQFTSLIFCRVQIRGLGWPWQKLHFVLILMFVLDYCPDRRSNHKPVIRFLTEAVRF